MDLQNVARAESLVLNSPVGGSYNIFLVVSRHFH
jgi:hypothetical protein